MLLSGAASATNVARGVTLTHALLCADQATPLQADDLERLATAAYLTGVDLEFQRILERLHRAHVEAGARPRAARCAFWLGLTLLFAARSVTRMHGRREVRGSSRTKTASSEAG